jgi:hypothetical protein
VTPTTAGAGLLVLAVTAVYGNSLSGAHRFDDYAVIVHNASVHDWSAWWQGLSGLRSLLKATYTLNWTMNGEDALGFHPFNLLVHGLNAILVFMLLSHLGAGKLDPPLLVACCSKEAGMRAIR